MLSEKLRHSCELFMEDSYGIEQEDFFCKETESIFLIDDFFSVIDALYALDNGGWDDGQTD